MRKHKKIYYSSGLISILLLPILCITYFKSIDAFTDYRSINLSVWNGKENKEQATKFLKSKTFTVVNLTGDLNSDASKLKIAQKKIKQIISTKDSIKGLKFHFENKAEYWTYIRVLDILQIEKAEIYLPYKNDIWFANPKIRKPNKKLDIHYDINYHICSSGRLQNEYLEKERNEYFEKNKIKIICQNVLEFSRKYYAIIITYLLMLFFTFKRIIYKN